MTTTPKMSLPDALARVNQMILALERIEGRQRRCGAKSVADVSAGDHLALRTLRDALPTREQIESLDRFDEFVCAVCLSQTPECHHDCWLSRLLAAYGDEPS